MTAPVIAPNGSVSSDLIQGNSAGDDALAGNLGEYVISQVATGAMSTGAIRNVTTVTLSPGDWDVTATGFFNPGVLTSLTALQMGISTVNNSFAADTGDTWLAGLPNVYYTIVAAVPAGNLGMAISPVRVVTTAPLSVYLLAKASFLLSTLTFTGRISARRMR